MLESTPKVLAKLEPYSLETCTSDANPPVVRLDESKIPAADQPYATRSGRVVKPKRIFDM